MNVHLTFDIEIWCNGWNNLDADFPAHFERYVYGRSAHGDYALPKTLEILNRYGLTGVFFVEPLFAARFGMKYLQTIVDLIQNANQDVQLHLHPEWTDEISPPILSDVSKKRQHLTYYSLNEQVALIAFAKELLEKTGISPITAFRAGSFAANEETFMALAANEIAYDSSLNRCYAISGPDLRHRYDFVEPFQTLGVTAHPVAVFQDGFGQERPAQVGACSSAELQKALINAQEAGMTNFVIVSHNFEMLKPDTCKPDWIVVKRFESLCRFLQLNADKFSVGGFATHKTLPSPSQGLPRATLPGTLYRYIEQALRKLY